MTALLEVDNLVKTFRSRSRGEVRAVDGVSFDVAAGEIVGLLGPNGAGKTTTIKAVCGLVRPTTGSITVDGVDALTARRAAARRLTAVLEGNRTVYWRLSVVENLHFFAALRGLRAREVRARIAELVARFGLDDKANTPAMHLSRGMQQKLALACAVLPRAPLLLLDEPTLGLDVSTSRELRGYLRSLATESGHGIVLSSHDMYVVRDICDRVVIINDGRVLADDTIGRLVDLFKARVVRVTLDARVSSTLVDRLSASFEIVRLVDDRTIEVALRDGSAFYELVDALRDAGCVVEQLTSVEPDLEEIFLNIVRSGSRS